MIFQVWSTSFVWNFSCFGLIFFYFKYYGNKILIFEILFLILLEVLKIVLGLLFESINFIFSN